MTAPDRASEKHYAPRQIETAVQARWEAEGPQYFAPASDRKGIVDKGIVDKGIVDKGIVDKGIVDKGIVNQAASSSPAPFCIVIPPPNVTGSLHLGHAWDATLQDVLTRWMRMEGRNTLWLPGTDHAGIATQWMVEKALAKEGLRKEDLGREAFLKRLWAFKEHSHQTITGQIKRLGVSCDWSRERFTLEPALSRAVRKAFVELYRQGYIYRAERMVNWSPALLSAVSDLEVEHRPTQGMLWYLRYPLVPESPGPESPGPESPGPESPGPESPGPESIGEAAPSVLADSGPPKQNAGEHLIVATTRPETLFGDAAVAVHPQDVRYRHLAGRRVQLPLSSREIPILFDEQVDPKFGSGALKITPAHDPNDFALGRRHTLPAYEVLAADGSMVGAEVPQELQGLDRFAARKRVVQMLREQGLLAAERPHEHTVGHCSRSGCVVEPRISVQWFLNVQQMAQRATEAVQNKTVRLLPAFQEKIFFEWMEHIQDWCISRQLWWGHRIPAWHCACGAITVAEEDSPPPCAQCGSTALRKEADVLDTWFSSALWPMSTLGWPDTQAADFRAFYPTSVLVTGYDILFFWVARMIMMGQHFTDQVPFHEVLLHGLLRDSNGDKMSKTRGNGLDPLELMDEFGADSLRLALASGTVLGHDMALSREAIAGAGNFLNKLWNASRFIRQQESEEPRPASPQVLGRFEHWILHLACSTFAATRMHLQARRFNEACRGIRRFLWEDFCDWYLEIAKPQLLRSAECARATRWSLREVLLSMLRLMHPFTPHITAHLWEAHGETQPLHLQRYPQEENFPSAPARVAEAERLIDFVKTLRTLRGNAKIAPRQRLLALVESDEENWRTLLQEETAVLCALAGLERLETCRLGAAPPSATEGAQTLRILGTGYTLSLILPKAESAQLSASAETNTSSSESARTRLERALLPLRKRLAQVHARLENKDFVAQAPRDVVQSNREEHQELLARCAQLTTELKELSS